MRLALFISAALAGIALTAFNTRMTTSVYRDLYPTYVAAKLLHEGKAGSVYANVPYSNSRNPDWADIESTLPGGADKTLFAYAPAYLYVASGLLRVLGWNYGNFLNLFFFINLIAFAYICWRIIRGVRVKPSAGVLLLFLFATAYATSVTLKLGQNMFVLFIVFTAYCNSMFGRRPWISCALLVAAVCLKPWCLLLILLPLLNKDLKLLLINTAGCLIFFSVQHLLWPELSGGYWKLSLEHSGISVLAYNNMSVLSALHRVIKPDWTNYANWSDAGPVALWVKSLMILCAAMIASIAWICHRPLVILTSFLMICTLLMNVFWDFYYILFLPVWIDLLQRRKGKYVLLVLILLCFYAHPVSIYAFFSKTIYRLFPYAFHDRIAAMQFFLPTILVIYSLYLVLERTGFKRQFTRFRSRQFYLAQFFTLSPKLRLRE